MDANEETLVLFTTRIRQLILRFKEMKRRKKTYRLCWKSATPRLKNLKPS